MVTKEASLKQVSYNKSIVHGGMLGLFFLNPKLNLFWETALKIKTWYV